MIKTLSMIAVTSMLSACATNIETVLRNDAAQTRYCYLSHDSTLARIAATAEYNKCLNDAGTAGFRKAQ